MCLACEIEVLIDELIQLDKGSCAIPLVPGKDKHALAVLTLYIEMIRAENPKYAAIIEEVLSDAKKPKSNRVIKLEADITEKLILLGIKEDGLENMKKTLH